MESAPVPAAPATPAGPSEKDLYLLRLARGVGSSTVARERKRDRADAQHAAGTAVSTETEEPEAVAEAAMTPETVEMPRVDEVAAGQEPEVTGVSVETSEPAPAPAAIEEDEPLPGGDRLEPGTDEVAGVESGDPIIAGYEEEPAAGGAEVGVEEPVSVQPEDGDETAPDFLSGAGQASSRRAAGDHRNISALIGDDAAEEDYRSHYDLGMAYMEMDLLGEAIREYQIASRSPQFQVKCLEMIGLCFIRQVKPQLAIRQLTRGLAMIDTDSEDSLGMKYNLGLAYEMVGELARARTQFEDVYVVDVTFRDVAEKVARLADAS